MSPQPTALTQTPQRVRKGSGLLMNRKKSTAQLKTQQGQNTEKTTENNATYRQPLFDLRIQY